MGAALASGLAVAGVAVVFALLRAGAARPAPRDPATGDLVLQCGRGLVWGAGLLAVGGPLVMAALSLVIPFKSPGQVFVPIGLGAFFLLIGGPMAWWAVRRRTRVGASGLTSEYMFAGPRSLPWGRVTRVTFASGQEFWVRGGRGEKAMLHVWFVGAATPYRFSGRTCRPRSGPSAGAASTGSRRRSGPRRTPPQELPHRRLPPD